MCAFALNEDIVATLSMKVVVVRATPKDVMTLDTRRTHIVVIVTEQEVKAITAFNPIVTFSSIDNVYPSATKDKVVAHTCKGMLGVVGAHHDDIASAATEDKLACTTTGRDDIVAIFAMQEADVVTILDDVVTVTTTEGVHARATDQEIVAGVTPKGIVAKAANKNVTLISSTEDNMITAVELQLVVVFELAVDKRRIRRCGFALDKVGSHSSHERIDIDRDWIFNRLDRCVDFKDVLHRGEDICGDMYATILNVRVANDH